MNKWYTAVIALKNVVSISEMAQRRKAEGQLLKSTLKNSWESCRLHEYNKYSRGDRQRAAVPDVTQQQRQQQQQQQLQQLKGINYLN